MISLPTAFATPSGLCLTPRVRTHSKWTCELVVVAGATGGVGRLIIDKLLASKNAPIEDFDGSQVPPADSLDITEIRALVRDKKRAGSALPVSNPRLSLYQMENSAPGSTTDAAELDKLDGDLKNALKGAAALIICTGTTAFPTRAWKNGNTPKFVDDVFVNKLSRSVDPGSIKRVVLVSSVGTGNPSRFPFFILNLFGVLDSKKRGEEHIRKNAEKYNHSYSIVRVGRLVGDPQTNIGAMKTDPDPNWKDIAIAQGDTVVGNLSRETAADAVVFASRWNLNSNLDFSVVHALGCSPPAEKWEKLLQSVESVSTSSKLESSGMKLP